MKPDQRPTVDKTTVFVAIAAVVGLAGSGWLVMRQWAELGVDVSIHGWVAYGLGATASIAVSAGLFYLLFRSARSGFDDIDRPEDRSNGGL
ncbi:MAG: hypothetical protein AAFY37_03680 [Pseudomonadota bacterium]